MRGRRPKPTHLKVVSGNPGKRPLNPAEPRPAGDLAKPPPGLTRAQRRIWAAAVACAPLGMLKRLDAGVLKVWVVACDLHGRALLGLEAGGLVVEAPSTGFPVQSPYLAIINRQAAIMLKAAAELGFTPSSRTRVAVEPEDRQDAFEDYLAGRKP